MLQIKLLQTGPGGITRKLTFPQLPLWSVLANRIETLYGIPLQNVGLTYIDSDGDEITISSQEELQDYHMTICATSLEFMKLTVKDLAVSGARRPPSDIESSGHMHYIPPRPVYDDAKPPTTAPSSQVQDAVFNVQQPNNFPPPRPAPSYLNFVSMRSPSLPRSTYSPPPPPPPPIIPPPVPVPIPQGPRGRSPYRSPLRPQASPMQVVPPTCIPSLDMLREYGRLRSPHPGLSINCPSPSQSRSRSRSTTEYRLSRDRPSPSQSRSRSTTEYRLSRDRPGPSQSRSPSPLPHRRMPPNASSQFGFPISFRHQPLSPGLFGPRSPVPVSRSHAPYEGINELGSVPETRPPVPQRRSADSLILSMAERIRVAVPEIETHCGHSGPPSRVPSREEFYEPEIRRGSLPRPPSPYRDGYPIRSRVNNSLPQQSRSALPRGCEPEPVCRPAWRRVPHQAPASPFQPPSPPVLVDAHGEIATDKATISNLDMANLTTVILNEVRELMAVDIWQSVQARLEEEKEKLLASVRMEMVSVRDELSNLTDDLDAANEQLRALGGINATHQEIIKARQEIQQARDEVVQAREATGRTIERIKDDWEETRTSCEEMKEAWMAFERSREETEGRAPHAHHAHHPHFPHMPSWVPPFPVPPPPPISVPVHHRLPTFVHRPPPAPMRPPPPPPPPPHLHPGHFHPHFHPPQRPHHHFEMGQAPLRPYSHNEASENDIPLQQARERGLRRRSTFPGRLNTMPHGLGVLRAKFSDGGLRFGVDRDESGSGFQFRQVDLLGSRKALEEAKKAYKEKMEAWRSRRLTGRREEEVREAVKEARKVYEEKRKAWNREREEARKGVLAAAGLGVRPFDTMTFPPAQPRTPAALPTHAEESSDQEENGSHMSDGTPLTESVSPPRTGYVTKPHLIRPIMLKLNSMGFTQELYPYLPRLVQDKVQLTDASEANLERMVQNLVEELLGN